MYSQCNANGNQYVLLDDIIDYRHDHTAITCDGQTTMRADGQTYMKANGKTVPHHGRISLT